MATARNPIQVLREAKQIAIDHGCFVAEKKTPKGTQYQVFRKTPVKNVYVGMRGSPDSLRTFVCKVTGFR